jgi:DNA-binding LacI/PurR family transcriptional regulator
MPRPTKNSSVSVLLRIKADLKQRIERGELAEGSTVPSEYELAREYEVSRNQTRLALRDLCNEGFILRSQGRRSVVAPSTQRLRQVPYQDARTLAIALPEYQSDLSRFLQDGFMRHATASGFQVIAYNLRFDYSSELNFLRHVRGTGIHGLAIWLQHNHEQTHQVFREFHQQGFPFILVDHDITEVETDFVGSDNELLGYGLTRELIRRGHRSIGFIAEEVMLTSARRRFEGFRRALAEERLPYIPAYFGVLSGDGEGASINEIMAWREPPTAFVCTHDCLAHEVVHELERLGYTVPNDLELAAPDDHIETHPHDLELVTALQASREMGKQAAEVLLARVADPFRPFEKRLIPPDFAFHAAASVAK